MMANPGVYTCPLTMVKLVMLWLRILSRIGVDGEISNPDTKKSVQFNYPSSSSSKAPGGAKGLVGLISDASVLLASRV